MEPKNKELVILIDNVSIILHTQKKDRFTVLTSSEFQEWFQALPPKTRLIVSSRLDMAAIGHFGDNKRFDGLIELKWKNGIRIYGFIWERAFVVALFGGNKNGQDRDIKKAKKIQEEVISGTRPVLKSRP